MIRVDLGLLEQKTVNEDGAAVLAGVWRCPCGRAVEWVHSPRTETRIEDGELQAWVFRKRVAHQINEHRLTCGMAA